MAVHRKYTTEFRQLLLEEYLNDYGATAISLAGKYSISYQTITRLLNEEAYVKTKGKKSALKLAMEQRNKLIVNDYVKYQGELKKVRQMRMSIGPKYGLNPASALNIARKKYN